MTDDRSRDDLRDDIGNDATMAPPSPPEDDGTAATMAAPVADVGTNATLLGAPPAPRPPERRQRRTSGNASLAEEMRGATVERLHEVARDEYEVIGEFSRGGLGRIFRARDHRSGRVVAIKEVLRADGDIVVRFAREALVTANLQHPSIVPVYEVGRWPSGEPFFAMKLVSGKSLDELVKSATSTAERLALLPHVIDVADALAYAHGEHVIHRDLKPANVLVGAYGETVVIDWGLAKNLQTGEEARALPTAPTFDDGRMGHADPTDSSETVAGAVVGTPAYMAPEQARGEPLDERADVYAIGAMLYQILGGARPYIDARTIEEILLMITEGPPRRLVEFAPELPRELIAIVEKAMAPDARNRYADAKGLAADLRRFSTGQLVAAHDYSLWQLITRWVRANRAVVSTAAVAVVALASFGGYSVHRIRAERDEASHQRGVAVVEQHLAEHRLGEGLEELGRQAMLAGSPDRALPFFAGAFAAQPEGPSTMRELAGRGLAAYQGLAATVIGDGATTSVDVSRDGQTVFVAGVANAVPQVLAVDLHSGAERWRFAGGIRALVSPDGNSVVIASTSGFSIVDAERGHVQSSWRAHAPMAGAAGDDRTPQFVRSMAWSADGRLVAAGEDDGTVVVHGLATGDTWWRRAETPTLVWKISFSPNGQWLAIGDVGHARFWRLGGPQLSERPDVEIAGSKEVMTFDWLDEDRVITADQSGVATMWSLTAKQALRQFAHGNPLYGAAMSTDRQLLATFAQDRHVLVWDIATGAKLADLSGGESKGSGVQHVEWMMFDGALRLIASYENGEIRVWDPRRGALLATLPSDGPGPEISTHGSTLAVAGPSQRIRIWDVASIKTICALGNHVGRVRRAVFDASGRTIYTASSDGTCEAIDVATGAVKYSIGAAVAVPEVAWQPGSTAPPPPPNPHGVRWVELSPDGALLATSAEDGNVSMWNAADGTLHATLVGHTARVRTVRFSPDGRSVVTASADHTVRRWDLDGGKEILRIDGSGEFGDARFSRDGTRVLTAVDAGDREDRTAQWVDIWDARSGQRVETPTKLRTNYRELQFDPRGNLLIASSAQTRALDADSGKLLRSFDQHDVYALDISTHDQPFAVMASIDGAISINDESTGAILRNWLGDPQLVSMIALRPDDRVFASSGSDGLVKLWDPADGRLLAQTEQPLPSPPIDLRWSPDGKSVLVTSISGTLRLWNVEQFDGTAAELTARSACTSQWRLDGTTLLPAPVKPCTSR